MSNHYRNTQNKSASDNVREIKNQFKGRSMHAMEEQKGSIADEIGKVGQALHTAARALHDSNSPVAAWADSSAQALDKASHHLASNDVSGVLHTAEDYARKYPGWTIAGMFLGGLALSRFFKSST